MCQTMEFLRFLWKFLIISWSSFEQEKTLPNMVKKIRETRSLKMEIVKNLMTTWIMRFPGRILTHGWEAAASSLQLHNTNSGAICHVAASLLSCSSSCSSPRGRRYYISICSVLILRIDNWVISTLGYIYWVISTLGIRCTMHCEVDGCWSSISTEINISFIWKWRKIAQFSDWKK